MSTTSSAFLQAEARLRKDLQLDQRRRLGKWEHRDPLINISIFECRQNEVNTNLIHGNNEFGILHSGKMLNSTGDAEGHVEFWGDDFARLTDLERIIGITSIYSGTRRSNGGSKDVCKWVKGRSKGIRVLESPSARYDAGSHPKIGSVRFGNCRFKVLSGRVGNIDRGDGLSLRIRAFLN